MAAASRCTGKTHRAGLSACATTCATSTTSASKFTDQRAGYLSTTPYYLHVCTAANVPEDFKRFL